MKNQIRNLTRLIWGKTRIQILVSLRPKPELLTHTVPKLTADILGSSQHIFIKTYQINFILPPINQMPCTLHSFHPNRVTYKPSPWKAGQVINSEGCELAGGQCHGKQQVALGWTEKAGMMMRLRCATEEQAWLTHPGDGGGDGRLATIGFPSQGIRDRQKGQAKLQGTGPQNL